MSTIEGLRARARGPVIGPDDDGYDEHRTVYNAMHDRRPAVIVRCADAADVIAAVHHARENDLDLAVRGGGHSVPGFGTCTGGVVVDLSPIRNVSVDPVKRTARAGGGATWGDFDHATHGFGLATTGGIISTTGVGGLTLGGGIGYLTRGHGLSIDNLLSADVVTADGRQVTASDYQHEDLFWALQGGGGNFGVVTALEFQLHECDTIVGGRSSTRSTTPRRSCSSTASTSTALPSNWVASSPGRSRRRCPSCPRTGWVTSSAPW